MSRFKFRVWGGTQHKWLNNEASYMNLFEIPKYEEQGFIFQQATGVKDKLGREIYEGDVINYPEVDFYNQMNMTVEWSEKNCAFMLVNKTVGVAWNLSQNGDFKPFQIIGHVNDGVTIHHKVYPQSEAILIAND